MIRYSARLNDSRVARCKNKVYLAFFFFFFFSYIPYIPLHMVRFDRSYRFERSLEFLSIS